MLDAIYIQQDTNSFKNKSLVIVFDRHPLIYKGLQKIVRKIFENPITIKVHSINDVPKINFDYCRNILIIVDVLSLGNVVFDTLIELRAKFNQSKIVLYSDLNDDNLIKWCLLMGGEMFISKCSEIRDLSFFIQELFVKKPYSRINTSIKKTGILSDKSTFLYPFKQLTFKELLTLKYLKCGMSNREIANKLGLSESTIKIHVAGIFNKVQVQNRTELVSLYYQSQLLFSNDIKMFC